MSFNFGLNNNYVHNPYQGNSNLDVSGRSNDFGGNMDDGMNRTDIYFGDVSLENDIDDDMSFLGNESFNDVRIEEERMMFDRNIHGTSGNTNARTTNHFPPTNTLQNPQEMARTAVENKCNVCNKVFESAFELVNHVCARETRINNALGGTCDCGYPTVIKSVPVNYDDPHPEMKNVYACGADRCLFEEDVVDSDEGILTCEFCEMTFAREFRDTYGNHVVHCRESYRRELESQKIKEPIIIEPIIGEMSGSGSNSMLIIATVNVINKVKSWKITLGNLSVKEKKKLNFALETSVPISVTPKSCVTFYKNVFTPKFANMKSFLSYDNPYLVTTNSVYLYEVGELKKLRPNFKSSEDLTNDQMGLWKGGECHTLASGLIKRTWRLQENREIRKGMLIFRETNDDPWLILIYYLSATDFQYIPQQSRKKRFRKTKEITEFLKTKLEQNGNNVGLTYHQVNVSTENEHPHFSVSKTQMYTVSRDVVEENNKKRVDLLLSMSENEFCDYIHDLKFPNSKRINESKKKNRKRKDKEDNGMRVDCMITNKASLRIAAYNQKNGKMDGLDFSFKLFNSETCVFTSQTYFLKKNVTMLTGIKICLNKEAARIEEALRLMSRLEPLWAKNLRRLMMDFAKENDKGVDDFTKVVQVHSDFGKEKCFYHFENFTTFRAINEELKGLSTKEETNQFVFDMCHPNGAVKKGKDYFIQNFDEFSSKWGNLKAYYNKVCKPYKDQFFGIEYNNFTESLNHLISCLFAYRTQELEEGILKIITFFKSQLIDIKKSIVYGNGTYGEVADEYLSHAKRMKLIKDFKLTLSSYDLEFMDKRLHNESSSILPSLSLLPTAPPPTEKVDLTDIALQIVEGLVYIHSKKERCFEVYKEKAKAATLLFHGCHFAYEKDNYKKYSIFKENNSDYATYIKVYETSISCNSCKDPICSHSLIVLGKFFQKEDYKKLKPGIERNTGSKIVKLNNQGGKKGIINPKNRGRKVRIEKKKSEVFTIVRNDSSQFFVAQEERNGRERESNEENQGTATEPSDNLTGHKDSERTMRRGISENEKKKRRKLRSNSKKVIYNNLSSEDERAFSIRQRKCCGRKDGGFCGEIVCNDDENVCRCRFCRKWYHENHGASIEGKPEGIDFFSCGTCIQKMQYKCTMCPSLVDFDSGLFDMCVCILKNEKMRFAVHKDCFSKFQKESPGKKCFCKVDW